MLRLSRSFSSTLRFALLVPLATFGLACGSYAASEGAPDAGGGDASAANDAAGSDAAEAGARPTVVTTSPAVAAIGVSTKAEITATFSEAMAAATLTTGGTFTVARDGVPVAGTVTYFDGTASFSAASELALDTTYTATISTAATDAGGASMAAAYTWSFKTDATAALGPAPVALGAAGAYVILAKTAVTNVPTSKVTGNVALSPAAASYITDLGLTRVGAFWTTPQVVGRVFAADNDPPTPANLTTAVGSMETAYTDAASRPTPTFLNLDAGALGTTPLAPGLYKWTSTVTVPTNIVLAGAANDVWIFQISGDLTMSADKSMTLSGGARAKNVYWQVAGQVELGTSAHAEGIVLSMTAIKLGTGASINGRLFAQTAVSIAGSTVTAPAP